jgi:hypothetical protein
MKQPLTKHDYDATIGFDQDGYDILAGDMVVHNRQLYRVNKITRCEKKKLLELIRHKDLSIVIVEDCEVSQVN